MSERKGQSGPIEGAPRVVRDDKGSITTLREWTGYRSELLAFAEPFTTPWEVEQVAGPVYKLTTRLSGNQVAGLPSPSPESLVVTVWDLKVSQQRRDLWELPIVKAELRKVADVAERTKFLRICKEFGQGLTTSVTYDSAGKATTIADIRKWITDSAAKYGMSSVVIAAFLEDLSQGVDSFLHNTFVLSKKRVGPSIATNLITEFALVNRPVTTGTLLAAEGSIPPDRKSVV